jgi:hypothetical protein
LWIAFILSGRGATRRYTYGFARAEELAGLFIVGVVPLSAVVAAWQSIDRLTHLQPLHNLGSPRAGAASRGYISHGPSRRTAGRAVRQGTGMHLPSIHGVSGRKNARRAWVTGVLT